MRSPEFLVLQGEKKCFCMISSYGTKHIGGKATSILYIPRDKIVELCVGQYCEIGYDDNSYQKIKARLTFLVVILLI